MHYNHQIFQAFFRQSLCHDIDCCLFLADDENLLAVRNGIYNLENLDLEELARDKVYEFAFIFAPLRLKGATGSPGNPMVLY